MKITREIDVTPSPLELATMFWDLDSDEQAEFFNSLYPIAGGADLVKQLSQISISPVLNHFGRATMRVIGDYSVEA